MDSNYLYTFREYPYGMYACIDKDNNITIGEDNPHEGGNLYAGRYNGIHTPYIRKVMKDAPGIFNKVWNYYHNKKDIDIAGYLKEFELVLTEEYLSKLKRHIPSAFFDETADIMSKENNGQATESDIIFACIERLKIYWEEQNGEDLVYVPAHFEKRKKK